MTRECPGTRSERRPLSWVVDVIALAVFLILAGVLAAVPGSHGPLLVLGGGLLLLAKNGVCHLAGLGARPVGMILGIGALVAALSSLVYPALPVFAAVLVAAGIGLLGLALVRGPGRRGPARGW